MADYKCVGTDVLRKDALEKVTGAAQYIEDRFIGPLLHVKMKKSTVAHGKIKSIDTAKALQHPGVKAVLTGKEYPNKIGLYLVDRNFLAVDKVRFWGEPVAIVAAVTEEAAAEAAELIEVEYEELPGVFDPREAMKPDAPLIHEDMASYKVVPIFYPQPGTNIANHFKLRKGDVEKGFAEADLIVERDFKVPQMQHVSIETHKAAAHWSPDGKLTVWSTAQSPNVVRQLLAESLGIPMHKIRVISSYIGGGFGGKAGASLEGLVVPLAQKFPGYVVRIVFNREEDMQGTFTRQALYSHLKTGVRRDGRITALEYKMIWDGGAYTEYGVNIVRAAGYSSSGAYEIPNVKTDSYCVYTNNSIGGPVRGFGMCEMQWGIERQMDEIAKELNMDPLEIRLINGMKDGSKTATGQEVHNVGFDKCLKAVADKIGWGKKEGKFRGKGISGLVKCPAQPSNASSSAIIRINEDGTAHVMVGAAEMGQGMLTAISQIAAETLHIPVEKIDIKVPDTDFTPYEWQSVGSRITYTCGTSVKRAAEDALGQIYCIASNLLEVPEEELTFDGKKIYSTKDPNIKATIRKVADSCKKSTGEGIAGPIIGRGSFVPSNMTNLDPETGQGNPGMFYCFGATGVEVEVDPETGVVTILHLASAIDAGKAINPTLAHAQLRGGTVMGLSTALYEELLFDKGIILNRNFTDYKICSIDNTPHIDSFIIETPEEGGPFGARGIGEQPMIGVAPAVANAVCDALGIDFDTFPLTPERVWRAINEKK
ncbi:MAG TPA: xanthine dehydrogenase family protein molybdopterin-binding subunit [Firmicutes bacterium]|nr:xanthine dehydrogenase family protein molybdopterin-binding subunit [Bacillota bacterium]